MPVEPLLDELLDVLLDPDELLDVLLDPDELLDVLLDPDELLLELLEEELVQPLPLPEEELLLPPPHACTLITPIAARADTIPTRLNIVNLFQERLRESHGLYPRTGRRRWPVEGPYCTQRAGRLLDRPAR
jgi:hypothetical protein